MESLMCEPCNKRFTSVVCLKQHEESEKHKKKLQRILPRESILVHCDMCHVSISGMENYMKHSNSLEHAFMVQKTHSTKAIIPFAKCKPSHKEISGLEPYEQHLASAGHKKICGPSIQILQIEEKDSIIRKENVDNHGEAVPHIFAQCDVCEMKFSGALSYQKHLLSDNHKIKAGNELMVNSFAQSGFNCDICVMEFSGPVPFKQHLLSKNHIKKMIIAESKNLKDSHIVKEQSSVIDQWYCDSCKKQCTGPIPFKTHMKSKEHSKTVRKLTVEKNLRKIKVSGPLPYIGSDKIDSDLSNRGPSTSNFNVKSETTMEKSYDKNEINSFDINVKSDNTKILSVNYQMNLNDLIASPDLNIVPPQKWGIAVFQPDDEIIFHNQKKFRQ